MKDIEPGSHGQVTEMGGRETHVSLAFIGAMSMNVTIFRRFTIELYETRSLLGVTNLLRLSLRNFGELGRGEPIKRLSCVHNSLALAARFSMRIKPMNNLTHFFICFLVVALALHAQRPARLVTTANDAWISPDLSDWSIDATGEVLFASMSSEDPLANASGHSSVQVPGGLHVLPGRSCLVCGKNAAGEAALERWAYTGASTLTLLDQRSDPSADYVGVVFLPAQSELYLLDAGGSRLLRGSWNGQDPLSSINFVAVATVTQLAQLGASGNHTLVPLEDGTLGMIEYPRVRARRGFSIDMMTSPPTIAQIAGSIPGYNAYAVPKHSSEGGSIVMVKAPLGVVFDVVKVGSGSVIGSGSGLGSQALAPTTTSEPLVLGERYVARVQGQSAPASLGFECVRRYGMSETLSDGTSMYPFFFQRGAVTGSIFTVHLALSAPERPVSTLYNAYLMIAFRLASDPVVQIGQSYVLNTSTYIPVEGWVDARATSGSLAVDVPIPAGLTGLVFLVQYWVIDGSAFKLSQVYGSAIK